MYRYHKIKCHAPHFLAIVTESKDFELRKQDRDYQVGDSLMICEFSKETGFNGNACIRPIKYILSDAKKYGLEPGYCILGLGFTEHTDIYVKDKTSQEVYGIDSHSLRYVLYPKDYEVDVKVHSKNDGLIELAASKLEVDHINIWETAKKHYQEVPPKQLVV